MEVDMIEALMGIKCFSSQVAPRALKLEDTLFIKRLNAE